MLPIVVSPTVASVISLESRAPDQERQLTNHVLGELVGPRFWVRPWVASI